MHNTFNVCDLSLVDAVEDEQMLNLRSNSSQDREEIRVYKAVQYVLDHSHKAKLGIYENYNPCSCKWLRVSSYLIRQKASTFLSVKMSLEM